MAGLGLDVQLFTSYGPAASIISTKIEAQEEAPEEGEPQEVPAAFPRPDSSVSIVDRSLRIVPHGVARAILVGGAIVGAGSLNHKKVTESGFTTNTYAPAVGVVYRPGDVGRLRADGALIFTGRLAGDTQVKLRGIGHELRAVANAVVTVRDEMLVAHVAFAAGPYDHQQEQNAFLRTLRLMLPADFVALA